MQAKRINPFRLFTLFLILIWIFPSNMLGQSSGDIGAGMAGQLAQMGLHPRTLAMGQAYTTLSYGPAALSTNPAGLMRTASPQMLLFHGNPINVGDIVLEYLAVSPSTMWFPSSVRMPLPQWLPSFVHDLFNFDGRMFNAGLSIMRLTTGDYEQYNDLGQHIGNFSVNTTLISFGYGLSWAGKFGELNIGMTNRMEHMGYPGLKLSGIKLGDYVFGSDVGILYQPLSFPVLSAIMDKIDDRYSLRPFTRMKIGLILHDFPVRTADYDFYATKGKNRHSRRRKQRIRAGLAYELLPQNPFWGGRIALDLAWIRWRGAHLPLQQSLGLELNRYWKSLTLSGRFGFERWYASEGAWTLGFGLDGLSSLGFSYGLDVGFRFFSGFSSQIGWGGGGIFFRIGFPVHGERGNFIAMSKGAESERIRKAAAVRTFLRYPAEISSDRLIDVAEALLKLDAPRAQRYAAMVGGLTAAEFWAENARKKHFEEKLSEAQYMARKAIYFFADAVEKKQDFSLEDSVRYVESLAILRKWDRIDLWIGANPPARRADYLYYLWAISKIHVGSLEKAEELLEQLDSITKDKQLKTLICLARIKNYLEFFENKKKGSNSSVFSKRKAEVLLMQVLKEYGFTSQFQKGSFPNYPQWDKDYQKNRVLPSDLRMQFLQLGKELALTIGERKISEIFKGDIERFY